MAKIESIFYRDFFLYILRIVPTSQFDLEMIDNVMGKLVKTFWLARCYIEYSFT